MIQSSNGKDCKLIPLVCPECSNPVPYSTEPYVRCPSCGLYANRDYFQLVE